MLPFIDFRSDTVTQPSPAMLDAMLAAKTGDDVFGVYPSELVKKLNRKSILFYAIAANRVRFVLHLDISEKIVEQVLRMLQP